MLRRSWMILLSLLASNVAVAGDHYLMLNGLAQKLTTRMDSTQIIATYKNSAIVKVPFESIEHMSSYVHGSMHGCGGFIDVTPRIEAGENAENILRKSLQKETQNTFAFKPSFGENENITNLLAKANQDRMWAFLTELSKFPDRSATSENGKKASAFLKAQAEKVAGGIKGFKAWTVATDQEPYKGQPSVVAMIPGTKPDLPGVVIGGHLDSFNNGKPAADDDGTGTTVVMESLRTIVDVGATFERNIYFIWYAAEERGLVGSSFVVKHFTKNKIKVEAALQFDMAGYKSKDDKADIYLLADYVDKNLNTKLSSLIATYLPTLKVSTTKCGYACSDHANWHDAGIPAALPFEASFENMNDTLHTADDVIDILDKDHLFNFTKIALAYLGDVAVIQAK